MGELKNIDEIIAEFTLSAPKNNLEALKNELTLKRNNIHPDKTCGAFQSEEQKLEYHRLDEAINFVDKQLSNQLAVVPVSQLPDIIREAIKALQPISQISQAESAIKTSFSRQISSRTKIPRISSATIGAISALVLVLWSNIQTNPAISFLAGSEVARIIWIILFFIMCVAYIWTWLYEQRSHGYVDYLLSESGLTVVLYTLTNWYSHEVTKNGLEFTKSSLIKVLKYRSSAYHRLPIMKVFFNLKRVILPTFLPIKMASDCADLILAKLLERGAIQKLNRVDIQEWYQLSNDMIKKIEDAYMHEPDYIY